MYFEAKIAVFEAMMPDIEALAPVERRKFAELCRRWADLADPLLPTDEPSRTGPIPTTGVLLEVQRELRSDE